MEESKNKLGHIYGSRISKNGHWLNVIVKVGDEFITCPIRICKDQIDLEDWASGVYAELNYATNHEGLTYITEAAMRNIPVYNRREEQKPIKSDDLPF